MDDVEAIKQLKARYFRMLDTKDWAGLRALLAPGVVIDTRPAGGGLMTGADEFLSFLSNHLRDVVTVHHGHMPEIELTSPGTAAGIWSMEDRLQYPWGREMTGFGHYHETYEKAADGRWQLKTQILTRLRVDVSGPAAPPA